jgi:hypothetical protein
MDPREIVEARPELQQLRRRSKLLLIAAPLIAIAAVAGFLVHEPAVGWVFAGIAAVLLIEGIRLLLVLGGRIEAIVKADSVPAPAAATKKKPQASFFSFSGLPGKLALLCFLIAGVAAAFSIAQFRGAFHTMEEAWFGPFFVILWSVVGFVLGGIGQSIGTVKLHERTLRAQGLRGAAKVLQFCETGKKVKGAPQVKCELEIAVPGRKPYRATVKTVVPLTKIRLLSSADPIPVFVDPADPSDVLVDW